MSVFSFSDLAFMGVTGRRLLYSSYVQDYLDRVTAADVAAGNTSGLELGVTDAANTFIEDLVSDTYLGVSGGVITQAASVIKASVPMAGARTLAGALVPVVGPAPTNFNFVAGDYNRTTGLIGDGSTKYLATGTGGLAANIHACYYQTTSGNGAPMGNPNADAGSVHFLPVFSTVRLTSNQLSSLNLAAIGLVGGSKNSSLATFRVGGINTTQESVAGINAPPIEVFRRGATYSSTRLAFYSIGESLDLALLDVRVTALINAYAAAIP